MWPNEVFPWACFEKNKQTNTPFAFSTDAQLVTRAEHMSEQLALEQSLLSGQQRQETFSPLC